MIITGIDSDLNGGIVTIDFSTMAIVSMRRVPTLDTEDTKEPRRLDAPELFDMLRGIKDAWNVDYLVLERAVIMPQRGTDSPNTKGIHTMHQTFGGLRAVSEAIFRQNTIAVWPISWKSKLGLSKDKELSINLATSLFPSHAAVFAVKKNKGLAEAALIAHWGNLHLSAQKG